MYSDDAHDASPSPAAAGLTNRGSLYSGYKALMKNYVGLNGASSPQDKLFACPADVFNPSLFFDKSIQPPHLIQKSIHDESFSDYSSYIFNGGDSMTRTFTNGASTTNITLTFPGLSNVRLSAVRHPSRTLMVVEFPVLFPYSWHDPSSHGAADKKFGMFYNGSKNVVSFVDGHVSYIKMDGLNVREMVNPSANGYDYQWSPD